MLSDCIHDVAHLVSLPINSILEDAPIAKMIEFPDDVVFVDGDWNKNSAVLEQKDLFGAVSVFVADNAVPNSEVLKVAETETVEGEVVVDFPAMDADGKNAASLRKVAIDEVLVPEVGVPQNDWFFDRFQQSSGRRRLVSTPLWSLRSPMCPLWLTIGKAAMSDTRVMWYADDAYAAQGDELTAVVWSIAESWPGVASSLDRVPLAMDTPGHHAPQFEQLMMTVLY